MAEPALSSDLSVIDSPKVYGTWTLALTLTAGKSSLQQSGETPNS
jgi:hypothetical protein